MRTALLFSLFLLFILLPPASAQPTLLGRFAPPAGAARVALPAGSFGDYLRRLPLLPAGARVHLYDGRLKDRQDVHAAVATLSVNPTAKPQDLQQCADAVMRLRAEYLRGQGGAVSFLLASGQWLPYEPAGSWPAYLRRVFAWANTESLRRQLTPVGALSAARPGDVLIVAGQPGHAVLVLDVAEHPTTHRRYALLGQSYMPAQQFHVLRNGQQPQLGAWFELADGQTLQTPEYDFPPGSLCRF